MKAMEYTSSLSDAQWQMVAPCLKQGNKSKWPKRELLNAALYREKTGCRWRFLPESFPPYSTVHTFYRRAKLDGTWNKINELLARAIHEGTGFE